MPSCSTYHLTWVSLTLDVGYLLTATPAKRSRCSLPWTRGISSPPPELVWWNPNSFLSVPTCLPTPFHLKFYWTISMFLNISPTPTPSSICLSFCWCGSSTPWLFCLEPFLPTYHTLLVFILHNSLQASNFSAIFCNCFSNPILITYVVLGAFSVVPHSLVCVPRDSV